MSNLAVLQKLLKKGGSTDDAQAQKSLKSALLKSLSIAYHKELQNNKDIQRELLFVAMYYGLIEPALTLDGIGQIQVQPLTRERVRQIINSVLPSVRASSNCYEVSKLLFEETLATSEYNFVPLDQLLLNPYFECFKKNVKGLISFLNDCGIKQIAYRKDYYVYLSGEQRAEVIKSIQKFNKSVRKNQTIQKMATKAKTVTYVPSYVKDFLNQSASEQELGLNELYQIIFKEFVKSNPYNDLAYTFLKTKSWKSRRGATKWEQIGIYIEKDLFDSLKTIVKKLKKDNKNVSFMAFICQSFIWHYNQNNS